MSHHLQQESQQQQQQQQQQQPQPERGRHHHLGGIMDLRNFCQRLDVDSLKAKLPALPQLKLPKSLPKLRGARRIFRSSRENVSGKATTAGAPPEQPAMPHAAQFINRTPQRISTISSLMHEQTDQLHAPRAQHVQHVQHLQPSGATYCSAGSLDDDYYAPYGSSALRSASRPISPIKLPAEAPPQQQQQERGTLTQRLQRGYKSLSELRLKHLFAKQTTIRRDAIEVQRYVEQYEAERRVEQLAQARRDREIADNYDIHISTLPLTRQNTLQQPEEEPQEESVRQVGAATVLQRQRSLANHSGDESGLETPPAPASVATRGKKPGGIAATRFAKVRQPPLQMPVEPQAEAENEAESQPVRQPVRQAVRQNLKRLRKSMKRRRQASNAQPDTDDEETEAEAAAAPGGKQRVRSASTLRARLRRFASSEQLQQRWRKSFKADVDVGVDVGVAREQQTATATPSSGVAAQLERTLGRLNEKMQQLKFFQRKSPQQVGNKPNTVGREPVEIDDEELAATYHHSDSDSDDDSGQDVCAEEAFGQPDTAAESPPSQLLVKHQTLATLAQLQAHASTAWSSESLEEDGPLAADGQLDKQQQSLAASASDYPRVLIHQQHTDAYESTLIIAVTTTPPTPSPPPGRQQQQPWLPNEQIIAGFKEHMEPWPAPVLYKAQSIDIFDAAGGSGSGGDLDGAFADFEEALRNAPVLRISSDPGGSSGDEEEDSSSRVTRIRLQTQSPRIGNSCESLMEQQTAEEEEEEEEDEPESERPPSMSPPPPPPPPLPQRRPPPPPTSVAPIYDAVPPPLPVSQPPALAAVGLPVRSVSMRRPAKPLVKTSSLRLTYNEQMHPGDVGKVNKLISRFGGRPRLGARRLHSEELAICSDGDGDEHAEEPTTPTPTPTPASVKNNNNIIPDIVTTEASSSSRNETLQLDRHNSNCSRSEYGSPLAYPQLSVATTTTTSSSGRAARALAPQPQSQSQSQSLLLQRRSRRSMTRDDDNFYSFDSDEENSYYSISPSSSSRYVVEI
ncbi:hypothetical protein KR093_011204 [Drosophila rubida]|uniref:Uncharacterized protein n=1 Tax=Drosophila rubida TaxID=30044 RepID=A0AAD4KBS7_9MUSC|nr:hypothetical protein KR093_011204 [Drosophila rubida]